MPEQAAQELRALPLIIQGGMGAGVSGWRLAQAVARTGQLGVVSGVALDTLLARRLQLGDPGGHMRRALARLPLPGIADRVLNRYFVPGGIAPGTPFRPISRLGLRPSQARTELTIAGNFVEVWLARDGHDGLIGINYLEKIQLATPPAVYGAMLAGVDYVLMGAGIPAEIPALLDALALHRPAEISVTVAGADDRHTVGIDPGAVWRAGAAATPSDHLDPGDHPPKGMRVNGAPVNGHAHQQNSNGSSVGGMSIKMTRIGGRGGAAVNGTELDGTELSSTEISSTEIKGAETDGTETDGTGINGPGVNGTASKGTGIKRPGINGTSTGTDHMKPLKRPALLAIVSSNVLAMYLARSPVTRPDGFILEGPVAGGHSAPPRGRLTLSETGEPVYGPRDEIDLAKVAALGLPFWVAGGHATPEALASARTSGAAGVQVGTAFALCQESGMESGLRRRLLDAAIAGTLEVHNAPDASPAGFPFKIADLPGTAAEQAPYEERRRLCDLGYLRTPYQRDGGGIGYRCAAEPVDAYVRKGGTVEETVGRRCLCNGLIANIGLAQHRPDGYAEPPLVTLGQDLSFLPGLLAGIGHEPPPGDEAVDFGAADVIHYLLGRP